MRIDFVVFYKNGRIDICRNSACFYDIGLEFDKINEIIFIAPTNYCSIKIIKWWYKFLQKILDKKNFSGKFDNIDIDNIDIDKSNHTIISTKNESKYFLWKINAENFSCYKKLLLYLTAFRYICEFPYLVKMLYKQSNKDTIDKQFENFQQLHVKEKIGDNHALICGYSYNYYNNGKPFEPITLSHFKANLKTDLTTVYTYFK